MTNLITDWYNNCQNYYNIDELSIFVRKSRVLDNIIKNTIHPKTMNEELEVIILGNAIISKSEWNTKKEAELTIRNQQFNSFRCNLNVENATSTSAISDKNGPEISVLVSVYMPGDLFDSFLGEIVTQTIFKDVEIVIVLVCPDLSEVDLLNEFAA